MKYFYSMMIFIFLLVNILNPQKKPDYGNAFLLYQQKDYTNSYSSFKAILDNKNTNIIGDYVLYYFARSAMNIKKYEEAASHFNQVINEHPNSLLVPYSKQYMALSKFIVDDFMVEAFFNGNTQNWIKEFVATKSLPIVIKNGRPDKASLISKILIDRYDRIEGAAYYHKNYKEDIAKNNDIKLISKLAKIFYDASQYNNALYYYNLMTINNDYTEESMYRIASIYEKKGERTKAIEMYNAYLNNKDYKKYRNTVSFSIAEQYYLMKKYNASNDAYIKYIKTYKNKSSYLLRSYRRIVVNYLRNNNFTNAKSYVDFLYKNYPDEYMTDVSLRNYMRKSFLASNKKEAYETVDKIKTLYTTSMRVGYGLSWGRFTYLEFGDTNRALEEVQKTLLYSKNPHHILEAYSLATDEMKNLVSFSNDIYFKEAKDYYRNGNKDKAYERLNRIQFNDAIVLLRETSFLKDVRKFSKSIMMESDFVKDFYANKRESEIVNDLSIYTKKASDKAIVLYYYGDYENAYNELNTVKKNYDMTFDMFYFFEKILLADGDTFSFFKMSNGIGKYFGYNYNNVELLPNEMRVYSYPRYYDEYVLPESKHYKIDESFVYAIMREESTFRAHVSSWAGAVGLMQLMPATARMENQNKRYNYDPLVLTNARQNINLGIGHLNRLFKNESYKNYMLICAKYNAGGGNAKKWTEAYTTNNMSYYSRLVTFEETENYIQKVMASFNFYERFHK